MNGKLFICSDIHGSAKYCEKMLAAFDNENADILVILGDVLYHGPRNKLPAEYDAPKVAEMLNAYKNKIICVRGNCDSKVDQMMLSFPILSKSAFVLVDGTRFYLTHGDEFSPSSLPPLCAGDVMLFGHSHIPTDVTVDGIRCLNPGSISIPKENSDHSYLVYQDREFTFKSL